MRFVVDHAFAMTPVPVDYFAEDHAFDVRPRPASDASVCVNDLELWIDADHVLYLTGYCPRQGWRPRPLHPPRAVRAGLQILDVELKPGIPLPINSREDRWPVHVNGAVGWVCIGDPDVKGEAVEFAEGCVAVLDGERLVALWLHPLHLP
jgi:hypothetical protein